MSSPIGICDAVFSRRTLLLVAAILVGLASWHPTFAQLSVSGEYEYYAALGFKRHQEPFAVRNRLRLRGRYARHGLMAYSAARLSNALSDPERGGQPGPFRVRLLESFLDLYFDRVDVRIGHQLVVWGQMDGVFITDVVSPLDLTEFLAQDFTDIRLAVPAIKASYYLDRWSLTGLLVASPMASPIPSRNSRWFALPQAVETLDVELGKDNLPNPSPSEVEPGAKVSYSGSETGLDLIYFYGRNRIPVFSKSLDITSGSIERLTLRPDYYRRHVVGARLSSTLPDPFVVESELAYESMIKVDVAPSLLLDDPSVLGDLPELLLNEGHLLGGLALSRTYHGTFVRAQVVGSYLTRYDDRSARDRFYDAVTLLIRSTWSNETLVGSLFTYYNPGGDYWLNPMLQYSAGSGLNLFVGAHVFGGDTTAGSLTTAAFGLFDDNDFFFMRLTLAF